MPDNNLIRLRPPQADADEHARAETERKTSLFAWADRVLKELGFADRVRQASTIEALSLIAFDADAIEVRLAIRDALHPASGQRAAHFKGLNDGALKRLLRLRFHEMKKQREAELCGAAGQSSGQSAAYNWTDDLILDDESGILPLLANLILFLRHHPTWQAGARLRRVQRARCHPEAAALGNRSSRRAVDGSPRIAHPGLVSASRDQARDGRRRPCSAGRGP